MAVKWNYIVPVVLPKDLVGVTPGKLPEALLKPAAGGGKLHWLAASAWNAMVAKAKSEGIVLKPTSSGDTYRSYDIQKAGFLKRYQLALIRGTSTKSFEGKTWYLKKGMAMLATPGKSQHNLGLAVDVHSASEAKRLDWLIANVKTFGFSWEVVPSEPWHLRYVTGDKVPPAVTAWLITQPPVVVAITVLPAKEVPAVKVTSVVRTAPAGGGVHLTRGDKGPLVKKMQGFLVKKGFPTSVDGDFGPATTKALNAFKKSKKLVENGICNQRTWKLLES